MFSRSPNISQNSLESRYNPIPWICWVLFVLFIIPQTLIVIAILLLKPTDVLFAWMFFGLLFSDVSLFGWSMYTLRTYIREDVGDWANLMGNFLINANSFPYMMKLATNMAMSANKHVVAQSPDITIKALSDDNESDSEFD